MKAVQAAWKIVGEFRRAYIILNLAYYGLIVCAMFYVSFNRSLQQSWFEAVGSAFTAGPLAIVGGAYTGGQVLLAVALTFVINLTVGSFISIMLPSLVIPFSGLLIAAYRAIVWGLLFSPPTLQVSGGQLLAGFLIAILLFLEGQGYVLTMLAAYVQGKAFLLPQSIGAMGHKQGYWFGIKHSLRLYLLVVLVFALAAVYEASVAIFIIPRLM